MSRDSSIGRVRSCQQQHLAARRPFGQYIFFTKAVKLPSSSATAAGMKVALALSTRAFWRVVLCARKTFLPAEVTRAVVKKQVLEIKLDDFMNYLPCRDARSSIHFTFCCRLSDYQRHIEFLAYHAALKNGRRLLHLAATRGKPGDTQQGQTDTSIRRMKSKM